MEVAWLLAAQSVVRVERAACPAKAAQVERAVRGVACQAKAVQAGWVGRLVLAALGELAGPVAKVELEVYSVEAVWEVPLATQARMEKMATTASRGITARMEEWARTGELAVRGCQARRASSEISDFPDFLAERAPWAVLDPWAGGARTRPRITG